MYVLVTKYNHKRQNFRQLNLTTPPPPRKKYSVDGRFGA